MCSDVKTSEVLALLFRCLWKILSAKIEKNVICCSGSLTQFFPKYAVFLVCNRKPDVLMKYFLFCHSFSGFHLKQVGIFNWLFLWSHILAICNNGCLNGNCTRPNVCTCNQGYRGSTCATRRLLKCYVPMWRHMKY